MDADLTPEELSAAIRIPVKTLAQWRWKGTGPAFYHAGRYVRYRLSDVTEWRAAQAAPEVERRKSA